MLMIALTGIAVTASPYRPLTEPNQLIVRSVCTKESTLKNSGSDAEEVANLPFAMGKRFSTLDSYLKHLECFAGPIDKPWWKEERPGIYRHMMTGTNATPEIASRAELMKRFGFSH